MFTFEQFETIVFIVTTVTVVGLLAGTSFVRIRRRLEELRFSKLEEEHVLVPVDEDDPGKDIQNH